MLDCGGKHMNINEFVGKFNNHPVLFIGTGMSLRYLENSFTWDGLLKHICYEMEGNNEYYLDIKSKYEVNGKYSYESIAEEIESLFNEKAKSERHGKFKDVNDKFYECMASNINVSRFKIHISKMLSTLNIREKMEAELIELKKVRKNIGSVITTNYDKLIESIFEFNPLIGNDILLSNPYGSLYKIHGCVDDPTKIIITGEDYKTFADRYELIRAQLLSLFIHNPIIFMGYNIGDENIKDILKTIFTYIQPNTEQSNKIRSNFLLVEYEEGSDNLEVMEHDIDLEGFSTIRINKLKTDKFISIYKCLSDLHLPISAMDVRKVQSIVKEIYSGGKIDVRFTEDIDTLKNDEKVLVFGSHKTISYVYRTASEFMQQYFEIIEEENSQILCLLDQIRIQSNQYFPMYGFSTINDSLTKTTVLKKQQKSKIEKEVTDNILQAYKHEYSSIQEIEDDSDIAISSKAKRIFWNIYHENIALSELKDFLVASENKKSTDYRKLICLYDMKRYG